MRGVKNDRNDFPGQPQILRVSGRELTSNPTYRSRSGHLASHRIGNGRGCAMSQSDQRCANAPRTGNGRGLEQAHHHPVRRLDAEGLLRHLYDFPGRLVRSGGPPPPPPGVAAVARSSATHTITRFRAWSCSTDHSRVDVHWTPGAHARRRGRAWRQRLPRRHQGRMRWSLCSSPDGG